VARFGVSAKTIEGIRRGVTWTWVKPARAVRKTTRDLILCIHCERSFPRPYTKGAPRKVCDRCRDIRGAELKKARALQMRMDALKSKLKSIVEELVNEFLAGREPRSRQRVSCAQKHVQPGQ